MAVSDESTNSIGRRRFIKSLFGLGSFTSDSQVVSEAKTPGSLGWFWCDLQTGFVGFPTGLNVRRALPGSVMKLISAAALSDRGLLNPNDRFDCRGHIRIGSETFSCQFAHGFVDLTHAIAVSCNSYFVHASHVLATSVFLDYARQFGLDKEIAGTQSGAFPVQSRDPSYTFCLGLNESLQPSALQLMRVAALIASKGNIPHLHSAEQPASDQRFSLQLHDNAWHHLQQGMRMSAKEGTCKKLDPENRLHVAGKTGTAMHGHNFYSWVIGYFPFENPRHAFCVSAPAGTSQESAVPRANEFLMSTTWPE